MTTCFTLYTQKYRSVFLLLFIIFPSACRTEPINLSTVPRDAILVIASGEQLRTKLAINEAEQTKGLSGTLSSQWTFDQAMLFMYKEPGPRRFWMPDTYFDLDIFFLNAVNNGFKVIDVQRNVPHHPGRNVPPEIATTRTVVSQMVLELRADSVISKKIEIGQLIEWKSPTNLKALIEALHGSIQNY